MPKYYCDYCDVFLTHDSPSVRKTHNGGRKHKENVRMYYQAWMEEQAQKLIDATTRAFTSQRMLAPTGPAFVPPVSVQPCMMPPRPFVHPMNIVRPAMMAPISGGVFFPPNIIPPAMAAAAAAGGGAIPPPITTAMIPQPSLPQPISATNTNGSAVPPPLRTIKQQPED